MIINKVIADKYFSDYIEKVYSIDNGNYPFLTYVGINFNSNEILNIKFYFSFFKRLSPHELKKVLPIKDLSEFNSYYKLWEESNTYSSLHQGTTFAIKITPDIKPTHYFHLRLNSLNISNTFNFGDIEPKNKGICKEYHTDNVSTKKYFYFDNKTVIQKLSEQYNMINSKFDINTINEIECVESDKKQKIDLITNDSDFINEFLKQKTSSEIRDHFKQICKASNFTMYSPGIDYTGKIFSIYFIDKTCSNAYIPFDGVKEFISKNS